MAESPKDIGTKVATLEAMVETHGRDVQYLKTFASKTLIESNDLKSSVSQMHDAYSKVQMQLNGITDKIENVIESFATLEKHLVGNPKFKQKGFIEETQDTFEKLQKEIALRDTKLRQEIQAKEAKEQEQAEKRRKRFIQISLALTGVASGFDKGYNYLLELFK